jgi:flagellar assembly factor FliW
MEASKNLIKFSTSHFGEVEISEDKVINLPEGIIGFPDQRRFALIDPSNGSSVFLWLQSIDEPDLAFILTDPIIFIPEYKIQVHEPSLSHLNLEYRSAPALFVIVTVPADSPEKVSANLLAPLIYFAADNEMFQVVLEKETWPLKYYLISRENPNEDDASSVSGHGVIG